jgi:hypothetical protein
MFPSSIERPFPRPGQSQNRAGHLTRQGLAKLTAQRREQSERPLRGRGSARELNNAGHENFLAHLTMPSGIFFIMKIENIALAVLDFE